MTVSELRRRPVNSAPASPEGDHVLYWMVAQRRGGWSFALQHAVDQAARWGKPLVILEALRCDYPWASDRLHRFVVDGMADNARWLASRPARYCAYLEPSPGAGRGLLAALAEKACLVVTDEFPAFFLPRMIAAAGNQLAVRLEAVDSNGLLPLRAAGRAFSRAVDLRRFLQRALPEHLTELPAADPFDGVELPRAPEPRAFEHGRWQNLAPRLLAGEMPSLADLPIDHGVAPIEDRGGSSAATERLRRFLQHRLGRYQEGRLDLERPASSELSAALHFGHLSPHQVFAEVVAAEGWQPDILPAGGRGQRQGWWGLSENAEAFLDQLVTWRELGFNNCHHLRGFDRYDSLPPWARTSLEDHLEDPRPHLYELDDFESASTHDELWNAAQRELVRTGRIHNYLRMLWGKKILEWSPTPWAALEVMIELNNKYAVDGRDPNSYSGIFWCLGRHDRAWGPEREIYGKVRYMCSASARRKLTLGSYLRRHGPFDDRIGAP